MYQLIKTPGITLSTAVFAIIGSVIILNVPIIAPPRAPLLCQYGNEVRRWEETIASISRPA